MTSRLVHLGVLFVLLGATVLLVPSFGFETLGAERAANAQSASDENATVGFEPTSESIDNRSDAATVFWLRNNADQQLDLTTSYVLSISNLLVANDGSGTLARGAANGVTVECGDYGGDGTVSFTLTVDRAEGETLTITGASSTTSFLAACNVPPVVWRSDADWSDGATPNRTVSDAVGDREADTVRLGYGLDQSGLVGYWPLDEDSGSTAYDATGNRNDGTVNGDPTLNRTGVLNSTAYGFDGTDDYVNVPHDPALETSDENAVTVSAWVRKDSAQSSYVAVAQKSNTGYNLQFNNGNEPTFSIYDGGWQNAYSGAGVASGQWHHLVGTFDGSTVRIYVDGEQAGTASASGIDDASDFGLGIGENLEQTGRHLDGRVDELRVYNRSLSTTEVQQLYRTAANGTHTTGWKTAEDTAKVDRLTLDDVDASLADGSATVAVQSDTDGDGTPEETSDPIALSSGTSTYDVAGLSTDTDRFRLRLNLSTPNVTRTPIVSRIDLAELNTNFTVGVDAIDEPVVEGEDLTVTATVANVGSDAGTQMIELTDFDGTVVDSTTVSLDGYEQTTVTLAWNTSRGDHGSGDVTVRSADDAETRSATVRKAATFDVAIDRTNSPVAETDDLEVDATVTNDGDVGDVQTVELRGFDGTVVDSREVDLSGGESTSFTLTWSTREGDNGTGSVTVASGNDSASTSATVEDLHLVSNCTVFDDPGIWRLTGDVDHAGGSNCFSSDVDRVTFQGRGHEVRMAGYTYDAFFLKRFNSQGNFTVRNVTVRDGARGVVANFVDYVRLHDVTIVGSNKSIKTYNQVADTDDVGDVRVYDSVAYDHTDFAVEVTGDGATDFYARNFTIGAPAANGSALDFEVHASNGGATLSETDAPSAAPPGNVSVGDFFTIQSAGDPLENVALHYDDAAAAVDESTLALWRDDSPWTELASTVDERNDTVSIGTGLTSATDFGAFAKPEPPFAVTIENTSSPAVEGEALTVNATVTNHEDVQQTQTVELTDFDGAVVDSRNLTLASGASETVALQWATLDGDAGSGTVTVSSDDDSDAASATVLDATNYTVAVASTNEPVAVGDRLDVDVEVTNDGPGSGTETVTLAVGGVERDGASVTLSSGESTTVTLQWATSSGDDGIYDAEIASPDDADSVEVSVYDPDGMVWDTAADWDGGTDDRTVSDDVGDRANDTVRLGYPTSASGLAAYWPLDEDAGSTTTDVVGGHDGEIVGNVSPGADGLVNTTGYGYDHDGRVAVNGSTPQIAGDMAVSLWVRTNQLGSNPTSPNDQTVFAHQGNYTDRIGWGLFDDGTYHDQVRFRVMGGGTKYVTSVPRSAVNDSNWHHLVGVQRDGSTFLYLDGEQRGQLDGTELDPYAGELALGSFSGGGSEHAGDLEEVRVYNSSLSQADVEALYRTGADGNHTTDWRPTGEALNASRLQLQDVSASLGGQNATVYVESDTDHDGTVDQTSDPVQLAAGQTEYNVTGLASDVDRARLRVELATDDVSETPVVDRLALGLQRPTFDVSITGTNEPITEGDDLTVDAEVSNLGDRESTQTIELRDLDGDVVDSTNVTLDAGATNASIALTWSTGSGDEGTGDVTVASPDDGASQQVTVEDGSQFDVAITGTNEPVLEGEELAVDANVTNTGSIEETETVELRDVDGSVVDSTDVTLAPGESSGSITLAWATQAGDNGTGTVEVASADDSATQSVTVEQRAHFDVNVTGTNDPVLEGEELTIDANVTNVGDRSGSQTIELTDFGGTVVDSTTVSLAAGESNASISLTWSTQKGDNGTDAIAVRSENDTATQSVTVEQLPYFDVTIDSTNSPVEEGQDLVVDATVTNVGDVQDTQTIGLRNFDGTAVDSASVTLGAGSTTSLVLTWSTQTGDAGSGTVEVVSANDTASQSVTVEEPGPVKASDVEPNVATGGDTQYFEFEASQNMSDGEFVRIDVSNASSTNAINYSYSDGATLTVVNGSSHVQSVVWRSYVPGPRIKLSTVSTGDVVNVSVTQYETQSSGGPWTVRFSHESADGKEWYDDFRISEPSQFDVAVDSTNAPVQEGQTLTVDATVSNAGTEAATKTVELRDFGGTVVDSTDVTLSGGAQKQVSLAWATQGGDQGTGNVTVASPDDSATREVTIQDGSQFDVTIDSTNGSIVEGETLVANVTVNNTGTARDTQAIELHDFGGAVVDSATVTLGAGQTNGSIQLAWNTQVGENGTDAIEVASADDNATQTVTVEERASFQTDVLATNSPVQEGQTLTVDANVTNAGSSTATQTVELLDLDGTVVDSVDVTLAPGESNGSITLEWPTVGGDAGTGNVTVSTPSDSAGQQVTIEDGSQFDVTVDSTNEPVVEGEALTANVTVNNTGTARDTQAIELHDFGGAVVDSTTVTLDAGQTNSSIQLAWDTQKGDNGTDAIEVASADDSATQTVTIDQTAYFDVAINGTNAPVMEGSNLTVDVDASNVGDSAATQTIELRDFDGTVVDSTDVSLAAGESDGSIALTWSTQRGDNGTDAVAVASANDTATQTVEVEREAYFAVSVDDTNSPEQEGEDVVVNATVENVGDRSATQTVELRDFDGTVVDSTDVGLAAGASNSSVQLVWSTQSGDNGTGTVSVASANESAPRSVDVWTDVVQVGDVGAGISPGEEKQFFNFTFGIDPSNHYFTFDLSDAQGAGVDYTGVNQSDFTVESHSASTIFNLQWSDSRPGFTFQPDSSYAANETISFSVTLHQTTTNGSDPWNATLTDGSDNTWKGEFEYR